MKIVCIADTFITPKMMEDAVRPYLKDGDEMETFYFGVEDKEKMREVARIMEQRRLDELQIPDGLEKGCEDADLIVVHLCPVRRSLMERAKKLKAVMSCRGGLENIEMDAASELGIIVSNNPSHNANAVAEYAIGMILCETRNISRADNALKSGKWRNEFPNTETTIKELTDMTVGIVGFGAIGRLVAEKLRPFGCRILVSDPFAKPTSESWYSFVPMDDLLSQSDIVTLHARANGAIMTEAEFSKMKQNSYLINTARAYLVEPEAFRKAMDSGKLLGAAIDVFETEPEIPEYYRKYDNITITNHRGGITINSFKDAPVFAMKNWFGYVAGEELKYFANKSTIKK